MAYADSGIEVSEWPFDYFIEVDSADIIIAEKGVLSKNSLEPAWLSSHKDYMLEDACALVTMDNVYMLSH